MKTLQEKLDFLLKKYSIDENVILKDKKTVVVGDRELPLLAHRSQRRFVELRKIVQGGTLEGISVMRSAVIAEKNSDLYKLLYREFDLCEFILGKPIQSVTVMKNETVLNALAVTENGIVCTIELAATLKTGEAPKEKHEIISRRGTACDIVVDAQLKQASIYVFGEENQNYTDTDFELYGLSEEDIAVVRAAFAVAQKKNYDELTAIDKRLCRLTEKARKSADSGEKESM